MRFFITIVAVSMGLAACLPAYVAEQMPDTDGERDIFSPAVAESHVAAKANLMDCKPFAPRGAQENEDAFAHCALVNERAQAQADLKAARAEIARLKATAATKPRPPVAPPMFQGMDVSAMPAVMPAMFQSLHSSASTRQPADMVGVMNFYPSGIVYDADAGNYRVCVFRNGAPVSVEVGGGFLSTLADTTGDGRVDGVYDCAPYNSNIYVVNVMPGDTVEFIYVRPVSRMAVFRGITYSGEYRRRRMCRVEGGNGLMNIMAVSIGCGS